LEILAQRVQYFLEAVVDQEVVQVHQAQTDQVDLAVVELVTEVEETQTQVVVEAENMDLAHLVEVVQVLQS
jgi:hypothetical protein|tara:strand:+ start:495 stop:707 length:213 start_codon:yes stop_codon:yes gene_type:complete